MLTLNLGTLVGFIGMFLIFMVLLNSMVLKPIGVAIERRKARIANDIAAGATARTTAAEIVQTYDTQMHAARGQAQGIVNDVLGRAQLNRQSEMKKVHEDGQSKVAAAKATIASERSALIVNLAEDQKELVSQIVHKLLGGNAQVFVDGDKARQVLAEEAS